MKRYIKSNKRINEIPIGTEVIIKVGDLKGEWGIVRYFDGEYYHVSPWGGNETLIFDRSELRVKR